MTRFVFAAVVLGLAHGVTVVPGTSRFIPAGGQAQVVADCPRGHAIGGGYTVAAQNPQARLAAVESFQLGGGTGWFVLVRNTGRGPAQVQGFADCRGGKP